jgi:ankyrin repeat protein
MIDLSMKLGKLAVSSLVFFAVPALMAQQPSDAKSADAFFRTIRSNDLVTLKALCGSRISDVRDRLDWTPLHYAAVYGSAESVRIILGAGGDPNARNRSQATPLIYGAYNLEKARLLVEKGGDVNARANDGSTPLYVASGAPGNEATVRYLIEKGADVKANRPSGTDYLMRAADHQDTATVQSLLQQGLDPHRANHSGETALWNAIACDGGTKARLLLDAGSDPNVFNTDAGTVKNGPIDSFGVTPLMQAANCGETKVAAALLKAGAKIDALDHRHMTALMMAVAADGANPETVSLLINSGASLDIADRYNETALDWARKYRNPAVISLLEKAGAKGKGLPPAPAKPAEYRPTAEEAIGRASTLLVRSNDAFFREGGGCTGCHHQPFGARAFAAIQAAGLRPEPRLRQTLLDAMTALRAREADKPLLLTVGGGGFDTFLYPLAGMAEMGEPATAFTDVLVHYIAVCQDANGAWTTTPVFRPPLQESAITQTMLAISALKNYGWPARRAEFDQRIARGRDWLLHAKSVTTVEEADRLMGLWLAGVPKADLQVFSNKLLALQREDGGWAQTPYLDSDAFGTGAALYTLRKTGFLEVKDAAYQRGAKYLLDTQFPDGSWYVRSRVVKLQPYFQSAFPYDHDQWISNPATAYAVMALAPVAGAAR